jgi:hypothetical protein
MLTEKLRSGKTAEHGTGMPTPPEMDHEVLVIQHTNSVSIGQNKKGSNILSCYFIWDMEK